MTKTYMLTIPQSVPRKAIVRILEAFDCKRWVLGKETGRNGYKHWQVRCKTSADDSFFNGVRALLDRDFEPKEPTPAGFDVDTGLRLWALEIGLSCPPWAPHIEEANDSEESWRYERKEGAYTTSEDNTDILRLRFGRPRKAQERVLRAVRDSNDREIVIWYDPEGNHGKSWLAGHLWEIGVAHYVPPYLTTVKEMVQTTASLMMAERRELLIIDIPRSWKWSKELYTAIEAIKDGLIMDARYSARPINIRGTKVLVMTNTCPKLDALSEDRWRFVNDSSD